MNNIDLNDFAEGALREKFNQEFSRVLDNIKDLNTNHSTKRKLIVELTFQTDEARELSVITILTKVKLADRNAVPTTVIIDTDGNGNVVASEIRKQLKGQTHMVVNSDTGEILSESDAKKVIKFVKEN